MAWEHFSHGADVGIRGIGKSLEESFEMGAMALIAIITDPSLVEPVVEISVHCEAPDREILFMDWLNAIIFEMATREMLFSKFKVKINGNKLFAEIWGEPVDRNKHQPAVETKGATMTELQVQSIGDVWKSQCVVDV